MPSIPKVQSININDIVGQLIEAYGSSFLMSISGFILFIFILFLLYRFLKSRGWFKTPLEITLEKVNLNINQMNTFFIETMQAHEITTNMILANQEYKLSDEQVSIFLKDKEYIYAQGLMDICIDIFVKNNIKNFREKTISKMRSSFYALISKEDKEYQKLPNVDKYIVSTDEKIRFMQEHDIFTKLYDIMIEFHGSTGKTEDYIRNTKRYIENHISNYWMI